tara:strand:- start:2822 stop:3568 length:747 start_codon:yes stop_codon:yes gene_type:complete
MSSTSTYSESVEKYKKELISLLNISEQELNAIFKSTLYSLKHKLEQIGGESFLQSLMKLDYNDTIEYDKEEDSLNEIAYCNNIYDKNVDKNKGCFLCLCGKSHLKNLHLFAHEDLEEQVIIGSSCIKQVCSLQDAYSENLELKDKLNGLYDDVKTAERNKNNKPCYKCGDLCINKSTNYKFEHMNNYCRDCLVGKTHSYIKCSKCHIKVIPASQPLPYDKNKFKEICGRCWHKANEMKDWYKKKYNKN